jgi:hypothetical protein
MLSIAPTDNTDSIRNFPTVSILSTSDQHTTDKSTNVAISLGKLSYPPIYS